MGTYCVAWVLLSNANDDVVGVITGIKHDHVRAEQDVAQDEPCDGE